MFIYPENLKAKPMLWLWLLRDIAVIGIGALLSVLALTQGLGWWSRCSTPSSPFRWMAPAFWTSCAVPPVFSF